MLGRRRHGKFCTTVVFIRLRRLIVAADAATILSYRKQREFFRGRDGKGGGGALKYAVCATVWKTKLKEEKKLYFNQTTWSHLE